MSIIRNLLYNGASSNAFCDSILYNQKLLHNFILQHEPKFIIHCGSPENALNLALFAKETQHSEILHVKNWHPSSDEWLQARGDAPNPHKNFVDKIYELELDNYLVSFDGSSQTAYEVLNYRNLKFNMMISDNLGEISDYLPLMSLLQKNALHIRYIGDKKLSQIKNEAIFQTDIETSITYAQGYLIIGMDYLSLYENISTEPQASLTTEPTTKIEPETIQHPEAINKISSDTADENNYSVLSDDNNSDTDKIEDNTDKIENNTNEIDEEEREKKREERREERQKAREERRKLRALKKEQYQSSNQEDNSENLNNSDNSHLVQNPISIINEDAEDTITAARQALREKRAARREKRMAERS